MKNHWKNLKIADVTEFIRNGLNTKQIDKREGFPITRIETISDGRINIKRVKYAHVSSYDLEKYRLKEGDILFSHINSTDHIGKTALYDGDPDVLIHGVNLLLLRPQKEIIFPKFLLYLFKTPNMRNYFSTRCKKAVNQSSLNQQDIKCVKIPVPPLPIQRKIAAILEKAESALEKRRHANRLTDEFLKSAFLDMFGDPVRNPKGWGTIPIDNLVASIKNENPSLYPEKTYDYIDISSVNNTSKKIEDIKQTTGETAPSRARQLVEHGDVLVSTVRPNLNAVAIVPDKLNNPIASTGFCVLRPNRKMILHEYLFEICKLPSFAAHLTKIAKGASYPAVTDTDIMNINISVPPLSNQQKFAALVEKVEKLKQKQRASEKELQNLFNSLMQRAFRGEMVNAKVQKDMRLP